jgi:hypothetical protein
MISYRVLEALLYKLEAFLHHFLGSGGVVSAIEHQKKLPTLEGIVKLF